jgi:hypothetical protein
LNCPLLLLWDKDTLKFIEVCPGMLTILTRNLLCDFITVSIESVSGGDIITLTERASLSFVLQIILFLGLGKFHVIPPGVIRN